LASLPAESGPALSEDQRQLLAMSNFSWDSIAVKHISASQDIMDIFDQQNFTRQKPAEPGAEPFLLSDRVSVDIDRNRVVEGEIIDIETPIDTTTADADEEAQEQEEEEEAQEDVEQDDSDSGLGNDEG
jgi:hypothetical protein